MSSNETFSIVKAQRTTSLTPQPSQAMAIQPASEPLGPSYSLLRILWRRRWWVLLAVVIGATAGVLYVSNATPIYASSACLLIEPSVPKVIATSDVVVAQSRNYLYTQSRLLTSTPILSGAMELLGAAKLEASAGSAERRARLLASVAVKVGKADDIITVTAESPYPHEAAGIVNAVVESYVAYQSSQRRDTAGEILKILQREKVRRDAELKDRFEAAMAFKRDHEIISFGSDGSNIILQRLGTLSAALTDAEMELMQADARYKAAQAMANDPRKIAQLADSKAGESASAFLKANALEDERNKLILELAAMRQECTDDHPSVQTLKLKLDLLEQRENERLEELADVSLSCIKQEADAARGCVEELTKLLNAQRKLAQALNSKAVEYAILDAERKRAERICDILDSRIKEIDITEDAGALNISILETAQAAKRPSKPNKAQVMSLSLGLGLMLGICLAFLREWMDHRFKSADEIAEALGLPVLGAIPQISGRKAATALGRIVDLEPTSQAAEACRTLRTAVYFSSPDIKTKTLLVTSPGQGDGKSTIASNLAASMAQAGQKVLVLDADFRRPVQHRLFGIADDAPGVTEVLAGTKELSQAIQHSAVEGLDVLPCGRIPPNPSETLHSQAFHSLLEKLSEEYDHVLIDAPPVLPVADARILGATCDAALLVVHAQKSSRRPAQRTVESLLSVGTRILGVVANGVALSKRGYGYGAYEYGYGYGYSYYGRAQDDRTKVRSPQIEAAKAESA